MSKQDNWTVGMVYHLCPICCTEHEPCILIPKQITKRAADEVREAHGKVLGFSDAPCDECKKYLDKGYIAIIGFDEIQTKTNDNKVNLLDLYRIGLSWLKKDVAKEIYSNWFKFQRKDPFILIGKTSYENLVKHLQSSEANEEQTQT